jgi:glutamate-5-semialdehyde dehydrogenase
MNREAELLAQLKLVKHASRTLALAPTSQKNRALERLSSSLRTSVGTILDANRRDIIEAERSGQGGAFIERLTLSSSRIDAMARSVDQVAALPDPAGEIMTRWRRPNGLEIVQVRVPIGVIAIIYESRPNVTIDAAALCIKSGNAVVLRGGRESLATNALLAKLINHALRDVNLPAECAMFVDTPDREVIRILKQHPEMIDLIIPRGSTLKEALSGSSVPILPHFDGICHTYIDRSAELSMAEEICFNAKCSRPSVCNAMETLLVHREIASAFLPRIGERMKAAGVEIRGDERTREILPWAGPASPEDWDTEYLDLILAVKVVNSIDEAITFITAHGSGLADAIVTSDDAAASRFEREVDSATVYVNASTRFTDGFEFGFGAETGISTNRLHARGPMGLRELTTYKYIVHGSGQVRC